MPTKVFNYSKQTSTNEMEVRQILSEYNRHTILLYATPSHNSC